MVLDATMWSPAVADVEQGEEVGRLAAGRQHGGSAALQLADLLCDDIAGGVLQAGVEIAVGLQVKQLPHILAGGIFKGSGLDNGDLAGLAVAGRIAALHADGITIHCNILLYWVCLYSTIPRRSTSLRRGIETLNFSLPQADGVYFLSRLSLLVAHQGAHGLERLHQQHQQDDTDDHDVGLVTVVAVGQSDLTQAAAANDAGHS